MQGALYSWDKVNLVEWYFLLSFPVSWQVPAADCSGLLVAIDH